MAHGRHHLLFSGVLLAVLSSALGHSGPGREPFVVREATLLTSDEQASLMSAAELATQAGRDDQANTIYRRILRDAPECDAARDALAALAGSKAPVSDSDARDRVAALLPPRFQTYETRRYVVFSDAAPSWTRRQAEWLEQAHLQFTRFARRIDLRPLPLRHKLVCVLFASRDEYQAFARAQDEVVDPWVSGYYAPRSDRIVFYHVEGNPSLAEARTRLQELRDQMQQLDEQISQARRQGDPTDDLRQTLGHYRRLHDEQEEQVETFCRQVGIATTIHEAAHQLLFHCEVQTPRLEYPLWICEGLATAFETDAPTEAFGPDREYEPRRRVFQRLLIEETLIPLRSLIGYVTVPDSDDDSIRAVYHQSYALVTWMCRFRRDELREYLELMARQRGRPSTEQHVDLFERAFGDVEKLERAWLRAEEAGLDN